MTSLPSSSPVGSKRHSTAELIAVSRAARETALGLPRADSVSAAAGTVASTTWAASVLPSVVSSSCLATGPAVVPLPPIPAVCGRFMV